MEFSFNADRVYIVELKRSHILLIAQLLHMHMAASPKEIGKDLLETLNLQTDCVSNTPKDHKVYTSNDAPVNATTTNPVWYVPFDKFKKDE